MIIYSQPGAYPMARRMAIAEDQISGLMGTQSSAVYLELVDLDFSPSAVSFVDQRLDAGLLGGYVQWTEPVNDSEVVQYNVYLADDAYGTGRMVVGSVGAGNSSLAIDSTDLQLYSYVLVYTESSMGEQDVPAAGAISDTSASVSSVAFVDNDADALEIAGSVTWTAPADISQVTGYRVYLCEGSLCSTRAQLGSHVATGTHQVSFSQVSVTHAQTHIAVYAKSVLAEQSTPETLVLVDVQISAGNISFLDVDIDAGQVAGNMTWDAPQDSQVSGYALYLGTGTNKTTKLADLTAPEYEVPLDTDTENSTHLLVCLVSNGEEQSSCDSFLFNDLAEQVSQVAFQGQDLDLNELGGLITWSPAAYVVYTQEYLVYLAEDAWGASRAQVESAVPVGTNQLQLSADTARGNYTHFLVYAKTSWQEQTTPSSLAFQDAVAVASNVAFTDGDLDLGQIGLGPSTRLPEFPGKNQDTSQLSGYYVYLAEDATGTGRSLLGQAAAAASSLEVPDSPGLSGRGGRTALGSFTHVLVYTASTLAEASTPKAVSITDEYVQLGLTSFEDLDLDEGQLGGYLAFEANASSQVTRYNVYGASDALGSDRTAQFNSVEVGATEIYVPIDAYIGTRQYLVLYAQSSYAEQQVPTAFAISDVALTVQNVSLDDYDLDADEVGGTLFFRGPEDTSK
ncbi:unnamed protein product, partial [Effrenium voratum]